MIVRFLATQLDRFLNWLAPPTFHDVLGPDDLADIEADLDCFDPDELHHLAWGSRFLATPPVGENSTASSSPFDVVWPAGTGSQRMAGAGGLFKSDEQLTDEQLIEELVADYRDFLRDCLKRG